MAQKGISEKSTLCSVQKFSKSSPRGFKALSRPHRTHLLLCPTEGETVSKLPALGAPICCLALSMGSALIGPPSHTRSQRLGYTCGKYLLQACGLSFHLVRGVFLAQGFVILV